MTDKKDKKTLKKFGTVTYNEGTGLVSMSFNPVEVFQKSTNLKEDDKENE